ncbi:MAG: GDSL-type esterase/lipase family protein [Verrucomicrobiales bacterium]|nr:GDSL-type esterase/lipase family protein [Verrucomicrobiales bacterium]
MVFQLRRLAALLAFAPLCATAQTKGPLPVNPVDAKNIETGKAPPALDPALERYGIYAASAPYPIKGEAMVTTLPLKLEEGDRIALVGNGLLEQAGRHGILEAMLYQAHPDLNLVIRNFAWSGDEVDLQPRPDNFATVAQHLTREKIDVVFAAFGFNESFGGEAKLDEFRERLAKYLQELKTSAFNGKTGPKIVLLSPVAVEGAEEPVIGNLALYTAAMAEVATAGGVAFVDVFSPTRAAMKDGSSQLTENGTHLNEAGYRLFAREVFQSLFEVSPPDVNEELRDVVIDKNRQYFRRYRPLNTFYYTGDRNKDYGYLDFLPAMRNFEMMASNREARVHALARGEKAAGPIDDSNLPPLEAVAEGRGANEWLTPAGELAAFKVDPRFEVNLFASEEEFPEIANPIQMRFDSRGRLWVSCSTTYPHVYPGQEAADKIVILEDSDGDGKADKSTVFADDVHLPISFELAENGVYVSEQPDLTLLEDLDGDDKADRRTVLLSGFGTEDSHHSIHDFIWTPDGDLLMREAIFHHSQVETAFGPVRTQNSAWFRYTPREKGLVAFGSYPNTNPWGVAFDDWGNHVASHPIFANAFHATNPPYPEQHPPATGLPAYSGTCGHDFVDFPFWPEEMQGGFIKARYKPTNKIEFHKWTRKDDHYAEEFVFDLIFSTNLSFIPVDVGFGPRGDLYLCDWYNPVKGHAQYSLRDPRRDRNSGRIWRVVPKGAALQDPPKIAGATISELLENLKRPESKIRAWSKRELSWREPGEVSKALVTWLAALDAEEARFRHHQIEALWLYRWIGMDSRSLLDELLGCEVPEARAAAVRQLRHLSPDTAAIASLARAAKDPDSLVRMEAVTVASYFGKSAALEAIMPVFDQPMGDHLRYAARCALNSEALRPAVKESEAHPSLSAFLKSWDTKKDKPIVSRLSAKDAAFDARSDTLTVRIGCLPERMLYDTNSFTVSPGQPVKLILSNPDVTQHNLVIGLPGSLEELGMAGNEMAKDPDGLAKGFIPESEKILHHTKMLDHGKSETLRFEAPKTPGTYPYLCTFPGHWILMKGEMIVK